MLLHIDMNQPRVYMCSPSWTPLPPPSPSHPSGSSQCTSPEHPVPCIKPGLMICFTLSLKFHLVLFKVFHISLMFLSFFKHLYIVLYLHHISTIFMTASVDWFFSYLWVTFLCFLACLDVFDWVLDIVVLYVSASCCCQALYLWVSFSFLRPVFKHC